MKKFDQIAEGIFRNLLEAPPPPPNNGPAAAGPQGGPNAGSPAGAPSPGLDQTGGPQPPGGTNPANDLAANRSPAELKNWETEILTWAKNAILSIQQDPSLLSSDAIQKLSLPTTVQNKDVQLDIIKSLGENL